MRYVTLDGNELKKKEDVHFYLRGKLKLCGYYGNNLDALWDVLSTLDEPLRIELLHPEQLTTYLGDYGKRIIKVFEDAMEENPNILFQQIGK